jgi:hypothetical protein
MERAADPRAEDIRPRRDRRRRARLVLEQHQRRRAGERQRRLALLGLQRHPLAVTPHLMGEANRRPVQHAELDVFPPQPEQLALATAHDAREPEQRPPRFRRCREHLRQLSADVDSALRRCAGLRPLACFQLGERIVAAPRAVPASELEDVRRARPDPSAACTKMSEPYSRRASRAVSCSPPIVSPPSLARDGMIVSGYPRGYDVLAPRIPWLSAERG